MTEETLFAAALEHSDPAARAAYLDEACAGDPALRRRVEGLLTAHARAGDFLEQAPSTPTTAPTVRLDRSDTPLPASPTRPDGLPPLQPTTDPESLGRLGHYEVLGEVGRGAFGIVLKARDTVLQRTVAIKVLAAELSTSGAARQRFLEEARRGASIRHEHVVAIHAVEESPVPFLVMDYIDGKTLQDKIRTSGPLPPAEVLRVGMQIAEGLTASHRQGLIHRDIKPANILLENGIQAVKITDFGLARAYDDASQSRSGVLAGTPEYMSPEQAEGSHALDPRSDLFSLGSTLYAACTGHAPFRAKGALAVLRRVTDDTPRPIREINSDVPSWLEEVVARLMTKRPEDRYSSAREVADQFAGALATVQMHGLASLSELSAPAAKAQIAPLSTPSAPRRKHALGAGILAGLLACALLGFGAHRLGWIHPPGRVGSSPVQDPLAKLPPQSPEQARSFMYKAEELYVQGRKDEAMTLLGGVLDFQKENLGPGHIDTQETASRLAGRLVESSFGLLGFREKEPGDYSRALQWTDRALAIQPTLRYGHVGRSWARFRTGDLKGALEDLDRSAQIDPFGVGYYLFYAMINYHLGDKELSLDWYAAACDAITRDKITDKDLLELRDEARTLLGSPSHWTRNMRDVSERLLSWTIARIINVGKSSLTLIGVGAAAVTGKAPGAVA